MRGIIYLISTLLALFALGRPMIMDHVTDANSLILIAISIIFIGSFAVFYLSNSTRIPSFVIAIAIGIASAPLLTPLTGGTDLLMILVSVSATLILFSGGLEMPFNRFRKIAAPVLLLSLVGVLLSTIFFGFALSTIGPWFGISIGFGIATLLGAILASTDPTVLIPMMKQLRFHVPKMKDMIIAESAVTDVTGALFTLLVLEILHKESTLVPAGTLVNHLFSAETGTSLVEHSIIGIIFGLIGVGLLVILSKLKTADGREHDVDAAFFLFVPIIIYAMTTLAGGSGFLAAFIAGLLFQTTQYLHETERFFNHIIDGFVKPAIFILLGAIVPVGTLLTYAPIGIAISLIFIAIIRPLIVFISLIPTQLTRSQRLTYGEIFGLAAIRETGAVPAVLIMSLISIPEIGSPLFLAIGLWVIIITVMILPAITPWLFEKLGIAERMPQGVGANLADQEESFVIIASRGNTFEKRMPQVVNWALEHNIHRVCLLVCPEDKYSNEAVATLTQKANALFAEQKKLHTKEGYKIEFFMITTNGFLHDAISSVPKQTPHAVAVFVGKRMLDFYLEEVQQLGIPLHFMD